MYTLFKRHMQWTGETRTCMKLMTYEGHCVRSPHVVKFKKCSHVSCAAETQKSFTRSYDGYLKEFESKLKVGI